MIIRPSLDKNISLKDFNDFYWLKEELVSFCRQMGINRSGGKIEIAERILKYLETGEITCSRKQRIKAIYRNAFLFRILYYLLRGIAMG